MSLKEKLLSAKERGVSCKGDERQFKAEWENALARLYSFVEDEFEDLVEQKLLQINRGVRANQDEQLGDYNFEWLTLDFDEFAVVIRPHVSVIDIHQGAALMYPRAFPDQGILLIHDRREKTSDESQPVADWKIRAKADSMYKELELNRKNLETIIEAWVS